MATVIVPLPILQLLLRLRIPHRLGVFQSAEVIVNVPLMIQVTFVLVESVKILLVLLQEIVFVGLDQEPILLLPHLLNLHMRVSEQDALAVVNVWLRQIPVWVAHV